MQTGHSFDTLVQYLENCGLGNDKTFHTLIRFVATVYRELRKTGPDGRPRSSLPHTPV